MPRTARARVLVFRPRSTHTRHTRSERPGAVILILPRQLTAPSKSNHATATTRNQAAQRQSPAQGLAVRLSIDVRAVMRAVIAETRKQCQKRRRARGHARPSDSDNTTHSG